MEHRLSKESLKEFPILSNCSNQELEWLSEKLKGKTYFKGESIYREGEEGQHVYFISDGSVKLGITSSCGKLLIKDILHNNDIFGENIFTSVSTRKEFAEVMKGKVTVFSLKKEDLQKLLMHNSVFANDMVSLVVDRLNALEKRMENFIFKKAKARIVDFIVRTGKTRGIKIREAIHGFSFNTLVKMPYKTAKPINNNEAVVTSPKLAKVPAVKSIKTIIT